ncbi:MAG: HEAT repeat domain-containing protein [Pseudomonadota bacterium]
MMLQADHEARGDSATGKNVEELARQLRSDKDYKIRLSAALNLGRIGDRRAIPALTAALADEHKTVRGVAAAALGKIVDANVAPEEREKVLDVLSRMAKYDPDEFVRGQAKKSYESLRALRGVRRAGGGSNASVYVEIGAMADSTKKGGAPLLAEMRQAAQKTVASKSPTFVTQWPENRSPSKAELAKTGTVAAFYIDGSIVSIEVSHSGGAAEVSCKISLYVATYPEKSMFAFLKGGGQVQTMFSDKAIEEAKRDCIGAVVEDVVARQVVPAIQQRIP